jgi:uncharacterized OsmC-like protein
MKIAASIKNNSGSNDIVVSTEGSEKKLLIAAKPDGKGSSVNGGELLFLSLATCFCNDVYREAAKRKMNVQGVNVEVNGNFGKVGEPGSNITYAVTVEAPEHTAAEINDLIQYVDQIAEIHNTLRRGATVSLRQ